MADSSTLYDEVILDHIKNARNYRVLQPADRQAEGVNPLCGDSFTVYLRLADDKISEAELSVRVLRYLDGLGVGNDTSGAGQDDRGGARHA